MDDWNTITMGRPSMGRARPLLLAVAAQRRREDMQGGPGVIPKRGQEAPGRDGIVRNDGGRVPGNQDSYIYLCRSRGLPAQARLPPSLQEAGIPGIRRQPHTQPHCLTLGSQFQSQFPAPPPIPLKIITILHPTPIFFLPHLQTLAHATTYAPVTDFQPHPLLMQTNQSPHQSQKTLMTPSLCFYNSF